MKNKIKSIAFIVVFAAAFALAACMAVSTVIVLTNLIASKNGFIDSFWTIELAVGVIVVSLICALASVFGIIMCALKNKIRYICLAVLLLGGAVACVWVLISMFSSFASGYVSAEEIVTTVVFTLIALALAAGIALCVFKFAKANKV